MIDIFGNKQDCTHVDHNQLNPFTVWNPILLIYGWQALRWFYNQNNIGVYYFLLIKGFNLFWSTLIQPGFIFNR